MSGKCQLRDGVAIPPAFRKVAVLQLIFFLALAQTALADRTNLKPGINAFTPQQDIQLGRKAARYERFFVGLRVAYRRGTKKAERNRELPGRRK